MAKAHIGTRIDEAQNSQTLQGKTPSDFLAVGAKAVDSNKLDGIDSSQFLRSDKDQVLLGQLELRTIQDAPMVWKSMDSDIGADQINWAYTDIKDAKGQRMGYFGITTGKAFNIQNELGEVYANNSLILTEGNMDAHIVTPTSNGFMHKSDKNKLDTIQANAINQSTADLRYVQKSGSYMTGDLIWDNSQTGKGLVFGTTASNSAYIKQFSTSGQLTIGTDNILEIRETDSDVLAFEFTTNDGAFRAIGKIKEENQLLQDRYAPLDHVGSGGGTHKTATSSYHGFMSNTDKSKLDGMQAGAINQGTADNRYFIKDAVNISNKQMIVHQQYNIGSPPSISLAIGDVDTGFNWVSDGHMQIVQDSKIAIDIQKSGVSDFRFNPTVNGNLILHDGNRGSFLASTSNHGLLSSSDKSKLNGIASGAEANQNAFSYVAVQGSATVTASSEKDTVTFIAGEGVNITSDASGMTVTLSSSMIDDFISRSGDNMSGNLVIANSAPEVELRGGSNQSSSIYLNEDYGNHGGRFKYDGTTNELQLIGRNSNVENVGLSMSRAVGINDLKYKGYTVLHNGNFSPSSKLDVGAKAVDSDKLDGVSSAGFLRSNIGTETFTGTSFRVQPSSGNAGFEIGATSGASSPFIDFHSGSTYTDYDSRLLASGGNGSNGYGVLTYTGAHFDINTPTGEVSIGSTNSSHTHFITDRPDFYFNRTISVDGEINAYSKDMVLSAGSTTGMTIKESNGFVGIGTSSPSAKLEVNGNLHIAGSMIGFGNDIDAIVVNDSTNQSSPAGLYSGADSFDFQLDSRQNTVVRSGHFEADDTIYAENKVGVGKFTIEYNTSEESLDFVFNP